MDIIHGQEEGSVSAGEFKRRCVPLLDRVAETGTPTVVTKHGRPVARVVPIEPDGHPIEGSLRVLTETDEELYSSGDTWETGNAK